MNKPVPIFLPGRSHPVVAHVEQVESLQAFGHKTPLEDESDPSKARIDANLLLWTEIFA